MRLIESDPRLSSICRIVERHLASIWPPNTLDVPVELVSDFDDLPEAKMNPFFKVEPAFYRLSTRTIYVNGREFRKLGATEKEATLLHETGHAYLHFSGPAFAISEGFPDPTDEDPIVDYALCRAGFEEQIIAERMRPNSYGPEYCEILRGWRNKPEYIDRMFIWGVLRRSPLT